MVLSTMMFSMLLCSVSISNWLKAFPLWTGFTLNNCIHQILAARYGESDMTIDFDNFVSCVMRLEMMFSKIALLS